jgi:ribosome biogenesis GTPase A
MKPRYSFSSRHTRNLENIRKQRSKYPDLIKEIIENSDIIIQVLDARFPEETRNLGIEEEIKNRKKKLIYIFNKSDLVNKSKLRDYNYLTPSISVSCKAHKNIRELRNLIKRIAKKIDYPVNKDNSGKITVGIIGYPNTGKSSLINLLIGKSSAGVGSDAGFTKGIQKLRLSEEINLLDSPGVIPKNEYSHIDSEKIAQHTKLGGRSYSQVKDPEIVVNELMKEFSDQIEKHYKIEAKGDSEMLLEELGKRKGLMKKGNQVDEDKTARLILRDLQEGRIRI